MDAMTGRASADETDSAYAWRRLACTGLMSTIGGVGMWSFIVALPTVQADFGITRADASLPYTLLMLGFAVGGIFMGRLADRRGIVSAAADRHHVARRRLRAVRFHDQYLAACAGARDPHGAVRDVGDVRSAHGGHLALVRAPARHRDLDRGLGQLHRGHDLAADPPGHDRVDRLAPGLHVVGVFCVVTMLPLVLALRRRPNHAPDRIGAAATAAQGSLGISPNALTALLWVAGLACCVAMSMPQVHIVAYCADLGYGVARGAEMLSLMLGFGVVSRIGFGFIADRIGGLKTLLVGSVLQTLVLMLYLGFSGPISLYLISALFGLVQGGIVPAYAIIVREYFSPGEAGARVGIVIMATLVGMAFGGWMSGAIFDLTGSYLAAFANGAAWNVLNAAIAAWLLMRASRSGSGRLARA